MHVVWAGRLGLQPMACALLLMCIFLSAKQLHFYTTLVAPAGALQYYQCHPIAIRFLNTLCFGTCLSRYTQVLVGAPARCIHIRLCCRVVGVHVILRVVVSAHRWVLQQFLFGFPKPSASTLATSANPHRQHTHTHTQLNDQTCNQMYPAITVSNVVCHHSLVFGTAP